VSYDPHLVVGILGGSAGTTYDAFKLIAEARKYGARAALFGRKINNAECQLAFVEFLRRIVDGDVTPEEAVRAYHGVLEKLHIKPNRPLADDLELHTPIMSYGGSASVSIPSGLPKANVKSVPTAAKSSCGCVGSDKATCECSHQDVPAAAPANSSNGKPDFSRMTPAEKLAYNQARRDRIFG